MNALMSTVEIVISRSKITVKSSCLPFHDFHAAADQQEQSPHWKMIYDDSCLINENEDTLAEQAILSLALVHLVTYSHTPSPKIHGRTYFHVSPHGTRIEIEQRTQSNAFVEQNNIRPQPSYQ